MKTNEVDVNIRNEDKAVRTAGCLHRLSLWSWTVLPTWNGLIRWWAYTDSRATWTTPCLSRTKALSRTSRLSMLRALFC